MKNAILTLCVIATAGLLSACSSTTATENSGAGLAHERTAGDTTVKGDTMFRKSVTK